MSSEKGPKYIYAREHKLYYYYYVFWGHWENKNWKKKAAKQSEEYFFRQRCKETATNTVMASRFWLAAYVVRLLISLFSLVYFSGLKYISHLQCNAPDHSHQTNFHIWQLRVNTSTQQPMERCSTYSRANFASRRDCQSNSQTALIGG